MIVPNARIIVCGGRHERNRLLVWSVLDRINAATGISEVIEGGQRSYDRGPRGGSVIVGGVDYFAFTWANSRRIKVETVEAEWERFRRSAGRNPAGAIRNAEMLKRRPDYVVAFPGGPGTANMVGLAERAGVAVVTVGPALP